MLHVWRLVYKRARYSHPNKLRSWVVARYFGEFNKTRRDKWVFGDRYSGLYLRRFAWTPIVRYRMVPGTASVDDPDPVTLRLLRAQDGRCPRARTTGTHGSQVVGTQQCVPTTRRPGAGRSRLQPFGTVRVAGPAGRGQRRGPVVGGDAALAASTGGSAREASRAILFADPRHPLRGPQSKCLLVRPGPGSAATAVRTRGGRVRPGPGRPPGSGR